MTHYHDLETAPRKPKRGRGATVFSTLTALLLAVLGAAALQAQLTRTVVVSPVPGDPSASGARLLNAVAGIDGSPSDPWLVRVEPGIFYVGTKTLRMKPWVDIEGSGPGVTVIQGLGQPSDGSFDYGIGVVIGADDATLRSLTVHCLTDQPSGLGGCICVANVDASPRLEDLVLTSTGYGSHWGIRNTNGSPSIERVDMLLEGGYDNYGVVDSLGSYPEISHSIIVARGGEGLNAGIFDRDGGAAARVDDTEILVSGGYRAVGVFQYSGSSPIPVEVHRSTIEANGGSDNAGISGYGLEVHLRASQVRSTSAVDLGPDGSLESIASELEGDSVVARGGSITLGSTRIAAGGVVSGFFEQVCAAVYDLGNPPAFHATDCPTGGQLRTQPAAFTVEGVRPAPWSELG